MCFGATEPNHAEVDRQQRTKRRRGRGRERGRGQQRQVISDEVLSTVVHHVVVHEAPAGPAKAIAQWAKPLHSCIQKKENR